MILLGIVSVFHVKQSDFRKKYVIPELYAWICEKCKKTDSTENAIFSKPMKNFNSTLDTIIWKTGIQIALKFQSFNF